MKYRIENINIPESGGIAHPGDPGDQSRELPGRRIIHVISVINSGASGVSAKVLTEEAD